MRIFRETKAFPAEERYSLTDQIRRSSRSVSINLIEAWRKRRYHAAFISKLSDAETEAAEVQGWLEYAVRCEYLSRQSGAELYQEYDMILRTVVGMIKNAEQWTGSRSQATPTHHEASAPKDQT